jgi:hypothetical protein
MFWTGQHAPEMDLCPKSGYSACNIEVFLPDGSLRC